MPTEIVQPTQHIVRFNVSASCRLISGEITRLLGTRFRAAPDLINCMRKKGNFCNTEYSYCCKKAMFLTFLYFGTLSFSCNKKSHASVTITSNALDKPDLTNNDKNTGETENFVSGTEVERRMFSGLVYNSKSPTVPSKVKKLENKGNNLRFQSLSLQEKTQQRAEAIEKMKIGVCACKFEDSITPTKVMGEAERVDSAHQKQQSVVFV